MRTPAALVLAAALAPGAGLAQKGGLAIPELGFGIKPPSGWAYLGAEGDRGSLRAMYCAPRGYAPKAAKGYPTPHTPTLRVLLFGKQAAADASSTAAGAEEWPRRAPYTSVADYLKRVHGPVARIESSRDDKHGGTEGKTYMVKVRREAGDLTLQVYRIEHEAGEIGVEFEVLAEQYDKLKKGFVRSLASISLDPSKARSTPDTATPPPWVTDPTGWRKRPAAERAELREAHAKAWLAAAKKRREPGYKAQVKGSDYAIVSRADSRFTKRVADALGIARAWVEERFAGVSDEVVLPVEVRVFADPREHEAYRIHEADPRAYHPGRRTIYFYKDANLGNTGTGFGPLLRGVLQHYLHDKDDFAARNLPRWLDFGLGEYLRSTRIKGRKLTFESSDVENGRMRYHAQHDSTPATWNLIQESIVQTPADGAAEPRWGYIPECARTIRWFEARGRNVLKQDDILAAYVRAVGKAAIAVPPDPGADVDWLLLNDSRMREMRKRQYQRRDALLKRINDIAVPLSVDDWKKANADWLAFNAKYKE